MNNKLKPAIIGGVLLGVLSVIPLVSAVNVCCCAWAIVGGMLATYLYVKNSSRPAQIGDGAVLGIIAGVVGAVVYFVLGLPIGLLTGQATLRLMTGLLKNLNPETASAFEQQIAIAQSQPLAQQVITAIPGLLIGGVLLAIFSTLGGILGILLFEKRKGGTNTTPPPPNYGNTASPFQTQV
ncbi:MAG: hypothetical protein NVSMB56_17180 [Pyrinomonadaceae bacterium]